MVAKMAGVCKVYILLGYVQNYFGKTEKKHNCFSIFNFCEQRKILEAECWNTFYILVGSQQLTSEHKSILRNKTRKPGKTKRRLDSYSTFNHVVWNSRL